MVIIPNVALIAGNVFESERHDCPYYEGICINAGVDQCTHPRNTAVGETVCDIDCCPILAGQQKEGGR